MSSGVDTDPPLLRSMLTPSYKVESETSASPLSVTGAMCRERGIQTSLFPSWGLSLSLMQSLHPVTRLACSAVQCSVHLSSPRIEPLVGTTHTGPTHSGIYSTYPTHFQPNTRIFPRVKNKFQHFGLENSTALNLGISPIFTNSSSWARSSTSVWHCDYVITNCLSPSSFDPGATRLIVIFPSALYCSIVLYLGLWPQ